MDKAVQHERRSCQRFDFEVPVSLRVNGTEVDEPAFTQDLSARGTFLYTDCSVEVGSDVQLTLMMPSEITLAESMRVRCRGKVLRVVHRDAVKNRVGLAVEIQGYEYLAAAKDERETPTDFQRISTLHTHAFPEDAPDVPIRRG